MKLRILITICVLSFSLDVYSFNSFLYDDEKSGYVEINLKPPFQKVWEREVVGEVVSSPVIYKDKVIVGTRSGYIIALDLHSGEWLWDYSTGGYVDATPYVSSDVVVVPSMDGYLYALPIDGGQNPTPLWATYLGAPSVSSPLVYKNKVYVGVGVPENSLKIVDFKTGKIINELKFEKPINSVISRCGERIFFGGADGKLYSVDEMGGNLRSYQIQGANFNMKAISCKGTKIYALPGYDERKLYRFTFNSDFSGVVKSFSLTTNTVVGYWNWQHTSSISRSTSALFFVVGNEDAYLFSLPFDFDGSYETVFSSIPIGNINEYGFLPTPIYAGKYIFIFSPDGIFRVINSTGGIVWSDVSESYYLATAAIYKGYIVGVSVDGKVRAYRANEFLSFDFENDEIFYSTHPININFLVPGATFWKLEYSDDGANYLLLSSSSFSSTSNPSQKYLYNFDVSSLDNAIYYLKVTVGDMYVVKKILVNHKPKPPFMLLARDFPNDNCNRILLSWNTDKNYPFYNIYRKSYNKDNFELINQTTSTTFIDNTVICGSTYSYYVTSYDGIFESTHSNISSAFSVNDNPLNDSIPPAGVKDLALNSNCPGVISYNFTQSGDDGHIGRASYYEVGYSTTLPYIWENATKIRKTVLANSGDIESGYIDGFFYGVTYYVAVRIYDFAGNVSVLSNIPSITLPKDLSIPMPPVNFNAYDTPGDRGGRITLVWDLSSSEDNNDCENKIYGYKIFRTTRSFNYSSPIAVLPKGTRGYIDTSAISGIRFFYVVCSYDSTNLSCSNVVSASSSDNYRYVSMQNGGVLSDGNSKVIIKPSSLNRDDYIIFYRVSENEFRQFFQPQNFKNLSTSFFNPTHIIYKLDADNQNTAFIDDFEINLVYHSTEVVNINEENLRIYYYNNGVWQMLRNSVVDIESKKVTAKSNKFGYYGLFGYIPQGPIFNEEWVYTYPNPAKGNLVTFKFVVNYNSDIEINVYNVAGEKIVSFKKRNVSAGVINEIRWDITDVASGVYLYVFKAVYSGKEKSITKKIAIIK